MNERSFQKWWEKQVKRDWGEADIQDKNVTKEIYDVVLQVGDPNLSKNRRE